MYMYNTYAEYCLNSGSGFIFMHIAYDLLLFVCMCIILFTTKNMDGRMYLYYVHRCERTLYLSPVYKLLPWSGLCRYHTLSLPPSLSPSPTLPLCKLSVGLLY